MNHQEINTTEDNHLVGYRFQQPKARKKILISDNDFKSVIVASTNHHSENLLKEKIRCKLLLNQMYAKPNKIKLHCEAQNYEAQTRTEKIDLNCFQKSKAS